VLYKKHIQNSDDRKLLIDGKRRKSSLDDILLLP